MEGTPSVALAVRRGNHGDGRPPAPGDALRPGRLHPVVLHAGGGAGAVRAALAGRRLCDGRLLSALQHVRPGALDLAAPAPSPPPADGQRAALACSSGSAMPTAGPSGGVVRWRWLVVPAYLAVPLGVIVARRAARSAWRSSPRSTPGGSSSGSGPRPGRGSRRPRSSPSPRWRRSASEVGRDEVEISVGYVGLIPSSYPINAIYQWTGGPEEAILRVALKQGATVDIERLKERLRDDARGADARRPVLVRAGRHRQRGDELRLADARRGRRHRAEPRRRPGLRREAPRRAGRDPVAPRPPVRPVARLPDRQRRDRPRAGRAQRRDRRRRSPARSSRPRRRAGSSSRTTGPTPRPASATRSRSRSPTRSMDSIDEVETIPIQTPGRRRRSCSATWPRSARGRCRASTTATT